MTFLPVFGNLPLDGPFFYPWGWKEVVALVPRSFEYILKSVQDDL